MMELNKSIMELHKSIIKIQKQLRGSIMIVELRSSLTQLLIDL